MSSVTARVKRDKSALISLTLQISDLDHLHKVLAKLRTLKTDGNVLLLKTNMAAGHGGSSGRYDRFKEVAFDYAFMLTQLGVEK